MDPRKVMRDASLWVVLFALMLTSMHIASAAQPSTARFRGAAEPKLAIVIDDFGQDRSGIQGMLDLPCPLTIAVMPFMEFTQKDAQAAHERGHQVIVHLSMQAQPNNPASWYGPKPILLTFTREQAYARALEAIDDVPYAVGLNPHVGSGCTENPEIMSGVMQACAERGLFFFDSKTSMKSVGESIAREFGVPFNQRDFFLEHEARSVAHVQKKLGLALDQAEKAGSALCIGHVGAEGGLTTVQGISGMLPAIRERGVTLVYASDLMRVLPKETSE